MEKRIVLGILAHVDAGKTTLSEALLYTAGARRTLGRVDPGVCQSKPRQELSKPHGGYIFLPNFKFSIVVRLVRCYNMQG